MRPGEEYVGKDYIMDRIEGFTGPLQSVPYDMISPEDLWAILDALRRTK